MSTHEPLPARAGSRSFGRARDLAMGIRFAVTGGSEGWVRLLLTAVGVGLGVALLLLTTALPSVLNVRHERENARQDHTYGQEHARKADDTLVISDVDTTFHDKDVRGRLMEPEGARAPLPPGVAGFPAVGEMVASPALKRLLASDEGRLLRERLPYKVVGTIGESGLVGSHELAYYAGARNLAPRMDGSTTARIDHFGGSEPMQQRTDPILVLLTLVVFIALLMPVMVFIATAVRFGGERRDRRLAALRLVGSDSAMTRRTAAGEALAGALLGLVLGTVFFLIGRELAGGAEVLGVSVFPSYLNPSPALAALVAVAVPAAAVAVTLFALRQVVIEPLGVVRTAKPRRRRLWWRLLLPLGGLGMLAPMIGQGSDGGDFNQYLVIGGVVLLLVGVTALLPWVVEAVVGRLGGSGVSWQLAVRRLQLSSGTAARMVNGVAVAVAGAIALQMLFAGVDDSYTKHTRNDLTRAQMQVNLPRGVPLTSSADELARTKGVLKATALASGTLVDKPKDPGTSTGLSVGDCASLREIAALPSCHDGDVFALEGAGWDTETQKLAKPGRTLYLTPSGRSVDGDAHDGDAVAWTVPGTVRPARAIEDPTGQKQSGVLMTPRAVPGNIAALTTGQVYVSLDHSVPDAADHVRNTAARIDFQTYPMMWAATETDKKFVSLRRGLFVGAACVLALIGASLLVSQLEQLRERRKLLSSLVAFGTRRRTLSLSVLWQTAIPITLGLVLASAVGVGLGAVLLGMTGQPVRIDWTSVLSMTGVGAGVVLLVTLISLPPLLRMMRPEGLRTE
ncbi:ABC transporter permease [Streptomyces sp. NPDC048664]|uniref:ABC transporter permease n=1 Tax=Streptomyces sp. NPDC048664 TaxID=3154505 RepID=UPI003436EF45